MTSMTKRQTVALIVCYLAALLLSAVFHSHSHGTAIVGDPVYTPHSANSVDDGSAHVCVACLFHVNGVADDATASPIEIGIAEAGITPGAYSCALKTNVTRYNSGRSPPLSI
jgi:hypothetical protein